MSSYATIEDLKECGLPAGALAGLPFTVMDRALQDRSDYLDGYIGDAATLPIAPPYPPVLVRMVCHLAAWDLLLIRGFNPAASGDAAIQYRAEAAERWAVRVANKQVTLNVNQASPPSEQPSVETNCPRGYGDIVGDGATDSPRVLV